MSIAPKAPFSLPYYVVDAFSIKSFTGNPAAVILLKNWLPDQLLQSIAAQINLSETAFLVDKHLRWFTPKIEVDLCGHATLATAHVLSAHVGLIDKSITFKTRSGLLTVEIEASDFILDFPMRMATQSDDAPRTLIEQALHQQIGDILVAHDRYICYLESENMVESVNPDFNLLAKLPLTGLIVTAQGNANIDFVSRYFAPAKGINEDPVTGTSHCVLAPLWAKSLNKTKLYARQLSERGGDMTCLVVNDRVKLIGRARTFSMGELFI